MHVPPAGMAASLRAGGLGLAAAVLSASKWREASSRFSEPDEDDAWDFDACCEQQAEAEPCIQEDFGYDTCGFEDGEAEVLSSSVQSSAVQLPLLDSPSTGSSQVCGPNCIYTLLPSLVNLYTCTSTSSNQCFIRYIRIFVFTQALQNTHRYLQFFEK